MRQLDLPDSIQSLALFTDSPSAMPLLGVSLVQLAAAVLIHIRPLQASRLGRALVTASLLILPLLTITCLYVAGLPKA
jgi:hypothetical protein